MNDEGEKRTSYLESHPLYIPSGGHLLRRLKSAPPVEEGGLGKDHNDQEGAMDVQGLEIKEISISGRLSPNSW